MTSLAQKSRQCLIDDINGLEDKLLQLQERFDLIVNWIRSQYCDLSGLPDYVIIAVNGNRKSPESDVFRKNEEHIKVEYDLDDSSHLSADGDIDTDNRCKNLLVKVDEDILKDIESGPVSRLRHQLEKRNLACRDISQDEGKRRNISYSNVPAAMEHEDSPPFPMLIEGEADLKWENDRLIDNNSTNDNEIEGNMYTSLHPPGVDLDRKQSGRKDPVIVGRVKTKRVKKTANHLQANKEKGLIIDAAEYKRLTESLPKGRLACIVCSKECATSTQLRRHELQVHLTKEEQNKLRSRSYTFNVVHVKNDVATMCDICNKPFKNIESHKLNHLPTEVMATVEGKWRPHYRCLKCDSLFSDKKKYVTHVTHECKNEKILENSNYAQHAQKLRTERNFLCNQCGQAFNRKHTLKIHVLAIHAKRKDFKCKYCGKGFTIEFVKNNHEKKHLGTLAVTCELCGFAFSCRQTLRKHIKGVHENHRPYQCPLCDKSFKTNNAKNYHVNTHGNPNGRKRGLNVDIDPLKAAAKRRHCSTWKNNRVPNITTLTTADNDNAISDEASTRESDDKSINLVDEK